jgi:hypothetical protein
MKKKKKAGKKKQAEVKEAGDYYKLDGKFNVKPTGTGPPTGTRDYIVRSGSSGSKRDIFNFTGSGPSK